MIFCSIHYSQWMKRSGIKTILSVHDFAATWRNWAKLWDHQNKEPTHRLPAENVSLHMYLTLGESSSRVRKSHWKELQIASPKSKCNLWCIKMQNLRRVHVWEVGCNHWCQYRCHSCRPRPFLCRYMGTLDDIHILWMTGRPCKWGDAFLIASLWSAIYCNASPLPDGGL